MNIFDSFDIIKNESCNQVLFDFLEAYTVHYRFTLFKTGVIKGNPTPSAFLQHINDVKFLDNDWYNIEFDRVRKKADSLDI